MERNLMIAGFGGQGVMTMGKLLSEATCQSTDLNVTFFPSYGAAMRGGTANCYVVISDDEIGAPVSNSVDDLVFINSSIVKDPIDRDDITVVSVPVTEMALEMGNPRVLNIIMLGAYIGYSNAVPEQVIYDGIHHKFEHKPKVIPLNDKAFKTGLDIGAEARQ